MRQETDDGGGFERSCGTHLQIRHAVMERIVANDAVLEQELAGSAVAWRQEQAVVERLRQCLEEVFRERNSDERTSLMNPLGSESSSASTGCREGD